MTKKTHTRLVTILAFVIVLELALLLLSRSGQIKQYCRDDYIKAVWSDGDKFSRSGGYNAAVLECEKQQKFFYLF